LIVSQSLPVKRHPRQGPPTRPCANDPGRAPPSAIDGLERSRKVRLGLSRPHTSHTESASFERFIGVDLGGGKGKKTALAVSSAGDDAVAVVGLLARSGDRAAVRRALVAAIRAPARRACVSWTRR
jgi:hypothetical protein